ncbi:7 transmembrane receptor [Ancylostoma caninum]|uniref:7 transmembrane receptor n=2 Tax=Ancylostoma TaxID=29169 RepID=A0A368G676_ANCCA|nr:7 transmembrane receptor [Ancylostoma caninum]
MWNSSEIDDAYANMTHVSPPSPPLAIIFGCFTIIGIVGNLALLLYILIHKLYQNFISSHFIAHLCITNLVALLVLLPVFLYTIWTGVNIFQDSNFMCRLQALLTCTVWTVMALMALCIAGVHLLTFARIHYDQLFGLRPGILCMLSWVISLVLALPSATNGHIVIYDASLRHCVWGHSDSGLKFLTYLLILGVLIPAAFSSYAYIRVLGILYHSPIVFQSLGLYKSRFLVYAFLFSPMYQVPFYALTMMHANHAWRIHTEAFWPAICMFVAFTQCLVSPALYGASLFMMKEEDMALTARTHKGATGYQHVQSHNMQAQLI